LRNEDAAMAQNPSTLYTPETANELLPEVRERLERLRDAYARIAGHRVMVTSRAGGNGGDPDASTWLAASRAAADELTWFGEAGIVLRDIERGLIDFPAHRDGREVYLCWVLGEEAVAFWHDVEAGFAGRMPL
jgi:hypothetical protein